MFAAVISLIVCLLILSYIFSKIYSTEDDLEHTETCSEPSNFCDWSSVKDNKFDTNKIEGGHSQYCRRTCRCMCYRCVDERRRGLLS